LLVNKQQVETFIPQKSPFVMVDTLLSYTQTTSVSQLLIKDDNLFLKNGFFQEPGLIENIAQTAALSSGYKAQIANEPVKKGFIGAVKRLKVFKLPGTGDLLTTSIHILNNVMNASILKGEIKVNDVLIAECELTIFTDE
jgi:3-hydroxymyristoyl/3-hydroxydecanoyl-(acyl carrier protein) dehydratase